MKKYYVEETDLISNCLIEINEKTNRRIIDSNDLLEYKNNVIRKSKEKGIDIIFCYYNDVDNEFNEYIHVEENKYFVMVPWINREDLMRKYTFSLPHEVIELLENVPLNKKENDTLNELEKIKERVYKKYCERLNNNIEKYEQLKEEEIIKFEKTKTLVNKR